MLEESTPRTSRKWKPHSTFAGEMNIAEKSDNVATTEHVAPKDEAAVV